MSWAEVCQAKEENRHELVLTGADIAKRIDDGGLDENIFNLTSLNFLEISRAGLPCLAESLGNLNHMTNLVLHGNKLKGIPSSIGALAKLKFLDLSSNEISELPDELGELKDLESLNLSCNQLSSLMHVGELHHLHILDVSHNQLEALPDGITSAELAVLAQILASHNRLREIPADLADLPALRTLDVESNQLDVIPPELSNCLKMKEFNYRGNKLKDRRLAKMMDQCSTKAVLDYLRGQLSKSGGGGKGKGKKGKGKKGKGHDTVVEDLSENVMNVLRFPDDGGVEVKVNPAITDVRPYIVCCIVRDLNLQKSVNMFKRFITLQTKLHDGVCQKRQAATIATHDLRSVRSPLLYDARAPKDISLIPLFKSKPTTADKLVEKLYQEAEEIRKEKKRNTLSGIHKYLDLVHGKPLYACLLDSEATVVSFPPITNCDITKVSKETTDLLIEVTSTLNLDTCKKAMDELLQGLLEMGVGNNPEATGSGAATADGLLLQDQRLVVEQVKILDAEGTMKVVYPSRTDLQAPGFRVERNYE